jgi:hypothetical protein
MRSSLISVRKIPPVLFAMISSDRKNGCVGGLEYFVGLFQCNTLTGSRAVPPEALTHPLLNTGGIFHKVHQ